MPYIEDHEWRRTFFIQYKYCLDSWIAVTVHSVVTIYDIFQHLMGSADNITTCTGTIFITL